jgi:hypothetical protein
MFKTLFSKQKWLIQSLPISKMESDDLIRELLFTILVNHVENKGLLQCFPWDLDEGSGKLKSQIENCYSWIKEKRPLLEDKIQQLKDNFPFVSEDENLWKFVNENHIGDIINTQQILREKDLTVLKTIIELREHLIEI